MPSVKRPVPKVSEMLMRPPVPERKKTPDSVLAVHQRHLPEFQEVFERSAEETIASMNETGRDVASQPAKHPLSIRSMGVARTSIPVVITNPLGGGLAHISCSVDLLVGLAAEKRGIHVSRMGDVLARLAGEQYDSLHHYASRLIELLRTTQHAETAHVRVQGQLPYLEAIEGVKSKSSLESLGLSIEAEFANGQTQFTQGVIFSHITACPCVQQTYRQSHDDESSSFVNELELRQMPLMTHSQRCRTHVKLRGLAGPMNLLELLDSIDRVAVRCQNTMPREFELLTVFLAHARPQFLEDVLRDLSADLAKTLPDESDSARIVIDSISMESIHDFDLHGQIDTSLAEVRAISR